VNGGAYREMQRYQLGAIMKNETANLRSIIGAAQRLGCGRSSVYKLIGSGRLRAIKIGKLTRIPDDEIDRCIAEAPEAAIGGRAGTDA